MKIIRQITDEQFDELIINSKLPVLILCTSPECIICKTMLERLKEIARDFAGKVIFLSLDVNKNQSWKKFDVRAIPTLLYFKDSILMGHQHLFPEKEEIINKLNELINNKDNFITEMKKSIEAEYVICRFYRYIANETKNGKAKRIFFRMCNESEGHRRLLETKFKELTGENYQLDSSKFESRDLKPQSFSLMGAIKTAIQTEENAFKFYKLALRKATPELKDMFKKLIKEETEHFKALKKELQFLKAKESFSSLPEFNYQKLMGQVWK